jgi:hypothetical protein
MSDRTGTNPFCTRYFQPGAIPFHFRPPMSLDSLVSEILEGSGKRSAIVGPHGSGKSTLLAAVLKHLAMIAPSCSLCHIRFHAEETTRHRWRVANQAIQSVAHGNRKLLVIDGWEQMDPILQCFTRWRSRTQDMGILATSHTLPAQFVEIYRTQVDATIERHVLAYILRNTDPVGPSAVMASDAWLESRQRHGQNLRESLFDMYDWHRDQVDAPSATG